MAKLWLALAGLAAAALLVIVVVKNRASEAPTAPSSRAEGRDPRLPPPELPPDAQPTVAAPRDSKGHAPASTTVSRPPLEAPPPRSPSAADEDPERSAPRDLVEQRDEEEARVREAREIPGLNNQ